MIGTDQGMCHYDYEKDMMLPYPSHVPARVFEASHRNQVFSDLEFGPRPGSGNEQYNLIGLTEYTIYGGHIYHGSRSFGNSINTVTYTYGWLDEMNGEARRLYMNQRWGMENGIFQNLRTYSHSIDFPVKHYLNGIQVNKLTTILGLAALDNNQIKSPS